MALLLSPVVIEKENLTSDGDDEDRVVHGGCRALQLLPILLSRLDDLCGLIMSGFGREQANSDEEYWVDLTTATAILHQGLDAVYSQLALGKARPFYVSAFLGF